MKLPEGAVYQIYRFQGYPSLKVKNVQIEGCAVMFEDAIQTIDGKDSPSDIVCLPMESVEKIIKISSDK